jgi:hypothetical protein
VSGDRESSPLAAAAVHPLIFQRRRDASTPPPPPIPIRQAPNQAANPTHPTTSSPCARERLRGAEDFARPRCCRRARGARWRCRWRHPSTVRRAGKKKVAGARSAAVRRRSAGFARVKTPKRPSVGGRRQGTSTTHVLLPSRSHEMGIIIWGSSLLVPREISVPWLAVTSELPARTATRRANLREPPPPAELSSARPAAAFLCSV